MGQGAYTMWLMKHRCRCKLDYYHYILHLINANKTKSETDMTPLSNHGDQHEHALVHPSVWDWHQSACNVCQSQSYEMSIHQCKTCPWGTEVIHVAILALPVP